MKPKTGQVCTGLGLLALLLAGCASPPVRVVERDVDRTPIAASARVNPNDESVHSSPWARVLPAPVVNNEPLAMVEYNDEYDRNDAALGVVHGPPGQPLAYYSSPQAPSLFWQYQFSFPQNANSVTVFGRPSDVVYSRPYSGYYRIP